jgi:hypothetical protein
MTFDFTVRVTVPEGWDRKQAEDLLTGLLQSGMATSAEYAEDDQDPDHEAQAAAAASEAHVVED